MAGFALTHRNKCEAWVSGATADTVPRAKQYAANKWLRHSIEQASVTARA